MKDHFVSCTGLTEAEAARRLEKDGFNEIITKKVSVIGKFFEQYANFLMLLLMFGTAVSFYLGDVLDAFVILTILVINGALGTFQEYRAEKLAEALKARIPEKARVMRDGTEKTINRRDLVVGDVLLLSEGQLIPADANVLETKGMMTDESLLTGESAGVSKSTHEDSNRLFSGSLIINGACTAVVTAVGAKTEFGQVVSITRGSKKRSSFLAQINQLSDFLFKVTVIIGIILFAALEILKPELGLSGIFLFSVAMVIAIVPEVLPLISTLALSRASLALAKQGVIVKRLSSLEDLGGIEVICTDKTGTITKNKLSVVDIESDNRDLCLEAALLASKSSVGSFDIALWKYLTGLADEAFKSSLSGYKKTYEGSFDFDFRWQFSVMEDGTLFIKGAPETLLLRCSISDEKRKALLDVASEHGKKGLRTLAVAQKKIDQRETYNEKDIHDLDYLGCILFEDPVKETVKATLERAKELGLDIRIITGDSAEVSLHVAEKSGMTISPDEVLVGADMDLIQNIDRAERFKHIKIFARINPKQKLEIISTLALHKSVLFLGEGVNDAPALKRADVGMVVEEASDIAKESADILLTKPDLSVIIQGVYMGRQIMNNIGKYILITLTGNFGSLFSLSIISTVATALPLLPTQVLLENILTDVPMIGIVNAPISHAEERKPVRQNIREVCFVALYIGLATLFVQLGFYFVFSHLPEPLFRTIWLVEIILFEFMLIISLRTYGWFWKAPALPFNTSVFFGAVVVFSAALPFIPLLGPIFHLVPYGVQYALPITLTLVIGFCITELVKVVVFRKERRRL